LVGDAGSAKGSTTIIIERIQSSGDHFTVAAHLQPTKNAEVRVKATGAGIERDLHRSVQREVPDVIHRIL